MKRRKNDDLISSEWQFFSRKPEHLGSLFNDGEGGSFLLPATVKGDRRRIQKIVFDDRVEMSREWFQQSVNAWGFELKSYHNESRTGVYSSLDGERLVTVQSYENWFARGVDCGQAVLGFQNAKTAFHKEGGWGFDFLGSPTLTGLHALESKIPFGMPDGEPSEEWRAILHGFTTQSRTENWLPREVSGFWSYDRRFAYAADAANELPCGVPVELTGCDAVHVPFEMAFYSVEFNVPSGWAHVGLLPVLQGDRGWFWPSVPGHTVPYRAFVAEPELRLAIENGWQVSIQTKWLFEKGRPFEKSVRRLVGLWERAKRLGDDVEAGIYRRILLQAIGAMYARSFKRESVVSEAELLESNDPAMLTAEAIGGDRYGIVDRSAKRGGRFYAPEKVAFIWSHARARLARTMLSVPFESLLGCHVDAIYTDREVVAITDNGKVGQFRLKGRLSELQGSTMSLNSMANLVAVKSFAEASFSRGVSDGNGA